MPICPCDLHQEYADCCGRYHKEESAPSALALMRSRYTAFCLGDVAYLQRSMRGKASLHFQPESTREWANAVNWLGLTILQDYAHPQDPTIAYVEFIARFMHKDCVQAIHELSEFHNIDDKWYYVDGIKPQNPHSPKPQKISKNGLCPCNSQKKYKNCHGRSGHH